MKILIVDDEALMRADLKDALERVSPGNQYFFAGGYDEAVGVLDDAEIDVAFLDIQMPGKNGLSLAQMLKQTHPCVNIVIVTAYREYALEALKLFVSGYVLKPVMDDELREVLRNLRHPVVAERGEKTLEVRCFGNFEVRSDGVPISFGRKKAKELFAYLVSLKGASADYGEICEALFDDAGNAKQEFSYFRTLIYSLRKDLKRLGFDDVLLHKHNAYSVNPARLSCDYYDFLTGKIHGESRFHGEFMKQYSWAERYIWELNLCSNGK